MYIVSDKQGSQYTIYDTEDRSYGKCEVDEVSALLNNNVFIYGVSSISIEYDIDMLLLLRFYDTYRETIMSYDGYIMEEEDCEKVKYNCHCINLLDIGDKDVLADVVDILRHRNTDVYVSVSDTDSVRYKFETMTDTGMFCIRDNLLRNETYVMDFFECISLRFVDKLIIDGLIITKDTITTIKQNNVFSSVDYLWKILQERVIDENDIVRSFVSGIVESAEFGYNELRNEIVVINDCRIPLYDIELCKLVEKRDFPSLLWWKFGKVMDFNKKLGVVEFQNGESLRFQDVYWFVNFIADNTSIQKDLSDYYERELLKAKVLNIKQPFENKVNKGLSLSESNILKLYPYRRDFSDDLIYPVMTDYGAFQVKHMHLSDDLFGVCEKFDGVFLSRVSNLGSVMYDTQSYSVKIGTTQLVRDALYATPKQDVYDLFNVIEYAELNGMTSFDGNLVPLCVGRVVSYNEQGVGIWVDCLVPRSWNTFDETANSVVTIPLHLMRGKFIEYNDCYLFKTVFHDIIMSKDFVYNQYARFSSGIQTISLFNNSNKKTLKYAEFMSKSVYNLFNRICTENELL